MCYPGYTINSQNSMVGSLPQNGLWRILFYFLAVVNSDKFYSTRISGCYAPFILGLPAGFPRAHARAHFVRFPSRARRGSCCSLPMTGTHIFAGSLSSLACKGSLHSRLMPHQKPIYPYIQIPLSQKQLFPKSHFPKFHIKKNPLPQNPSFPKCYFPFPQNPACQFFQRQTS